MLVMGMNASADTFDNDFDATGLIGVEIGYMGTEYKKNTGKLDINDNPIISDETTSSPSIGLKFGGESRHYRAFIEGRIWSTGSDNYNNGASVGGALQYLIPTGDMMNIFLGLNAGVVNSLDSQWDPYAGADAGINLNFSESYGLEVGTRYSAVDVNSDDYGKINDFYQFYVTAIFKFHSDY